MAQYNGHKNWNHWNVSLWINNDEGLYRMAQEAIRTVKEEKAQYGTLKMSAYLMLNDLKDAGITHTPDGAPYSMTTIKAAMSGMEK